MIYVNAIELALGLAGCVYLAAYAWWAGYRIKRLEIDLRHEVNQKQAAEAQVTHLLGQVQELTNVVGDATADRYIWHEEKQELVAKLFELQSNKGT